MIFKIIVYGMPVYLYFLELFLRTLAGVAMESIAGPTIAAAGIGFLIPLLKLKPIALDQRLRTQVEKYKLSVVSPKDRALTE